MQKGLKFAPEFNSAESNEIGNGKAKTPYRNAPEAPSECKTAHIAMRNVPFQDAKRHVLQPQTGQFAMQKVAFWGGFWWFLRAKSLHSTAAKPRKHRKHSELRLHTRGWRICNQELFNFKIRRKWLSKKTPNLTFRAFAHAAICSHKNQETAKSTKRLRQKCHKTPPQRRQRECQNHTRQKRCRLGL